MDPNAGTVSSEVGQAGEPVAAPVEAPVFRARGLRKVYAMGEVEVVALHGVDLDIAAGEFIVLLGASGSGKSTLLNILGGLDVPSAGEVAYCEHRLDGAGEAELTRFRREHVGFVFQFYNLIPSLTVRENVQLVADIADDPMPVDEAIERVGLTAAWRSPARSSSARRCCCATNRPARWTTPPASACWR